MNEIKELLENEATRRVIKGMKNNEYLKVADNLYLSETYQTNYGKILFFYPVVNNDVWDMPAFGLVCYKNLVEYFDAIEVEGLRKFVKILERR
jgi:hypothetical protein